MIANQWVRFTAKHLARQGLVVLAALSAGACVPSQGEPAREADSRMSTRQVLPEERNAYEGARPVFEKHCAQCHTSASGSAGALSHFNMDRYPFTGHDAEEMSKAVREVLGMTGRSPTMPIGRPGVVQGEELKRVAEWADAFDRAMAGPK